MGFTAMKSLTYFDGEWADESPLVMGPADNSFWLGSSVFDGARSFGSCAPDLDLHCQRLVKSARVLLMDPPIGWEEIRDICIEGVKKFAPSAELYIRPMFFATSGFIIPEPRGTKFLLYIHQVPMPGKTGFSAKLSSFRRPSNQTAPTEAKASCLYPNTQRALKEVRDAGFDDAVMLDTAGRIVEFATSNIMLVRHSKVFTPRPTGTFLPGITRARVMGILRNLGFEVIETDLFPEDLDAASEIFSTGNYGKVRPLTRLGDKSLPLGEVFNAAYDGYFKFAEDCTIAQPA